MDNIKSLQESFFIRQRYFGLLELVLSFMNLEDKLRIITVSKKFSIIVKYSKDYEVKS